MTTPRRTVHLRQVSQTLERITIAHAAQDALHAQAAQRAVDSKAERNQPPPLPAGGSDD